MFMSDPSLREVHSPSLGPLHVQHGNAALSHLPHSFVPALPLAREDQESLVRFLAGRERGHAEQSEWNGAFAAVPALRRDSAKQG
jgi:hypothetical protein